MSLQRSMKKGKWKFLLGCFCFLFVKSYFDEGSSRNRFFQSSSFSVPSPGVRISYVYDGPPNFSVVYWGNFESLPEMNPQNVARGDFVSDLVQLVGKPTGSCKKLHRFGGFLNCRKHGDAAPIMDGHKYICLDPELQVATGSSNPRDCFVLSFGVNTDISFDLASRKANCEVLMFDRVEYNHPITQHDKYINFFQVGVAPRSLVQIHPTTNQTVVYDTINNLAIKHRFTKRLINILKIDIDGGEWNVLEDLANQSYLNTVAQIAVEIHGLNFRELLNFTRKHEESIRRTKEMFQALHDRGFRKISYMDNPLGDSMTIQQRNLSLHNSGELLLVNSNFYKTHFREEGRKHGLNFMPLS